MKPALTFWVVYWNPRDFPGRWVLRAQDVLPGGVIRKRVRCLVGPTLGAVRAAVPAGLYRMPRAPDDDPVIQEVWV